MHTVYKWDKKVSYELELSSVQDFKNSLLKEIGNPKLFVLAKSELIVKIVDMNRKHHLTIFTRVQLVLFFNGLSTWLQVGRARSSL